ncbi:MAG: hypothetical protein ACRD0H_29170, partial [Actinomycetes bacterium]
MPGDPIGVLGAPSSSSVLPVAVEELSDRTLRATEPANMAAPASAAPKITGCRMNGRRRGD